MITRKEKPVSKTRERIVDAALELFVSQGVAATTTRDIAQAAGIAEGTIYRHFESKEALATDIFLTGFVPLGKALVDLDRQQGTMLEKLERMAGHFYRLFDADPKLWIYIMTYQTGPQSKVPEGTPTPYSMMLILLTEAIAKGELANLEPHLGTQILLGMILQPATGVVYGEIGMPLSPRLPEVMRAIRRVVSP